MIQKIVIVLIFLAAIAYMLRKVFGKQDRSQHHCCCKHQHCDNKAQTIEVVEVEVESKKSN